MAPVNARSVLMTDDETEGVVSDGPRFGWRVFSVGEVEVFCWGRRCCMVDMVDDCLVYDSIEPDMFRRVARDFWCERTRLLAR